MDTRAAANTPKDAMSDEKQMLQDLSDQEYKWGFITDIESDTVAPGLNEDVIRFISHKKNEPVWLLEFRLKAYAHFLTLTPPTWQKVQYDEVDLQAISYYSAPKQKKKVDSIDDVDPEILATYEKLGIPLMEQKRLENVAVDAVFDSVSVATTHQKKLADMGVIFMPFAA